MLDVSFLLGSSVLAVLIVQVIKETLGLVSSRWGALASQIALLVIAFGMAGFGILFNKLPTQFVETTGLVFTTAMAIYEILFKAVYQKAIKGK